MTSDEVWEDRFTDARRAIAEDWSQKKRDRSRRKRRVAAAVIALIVAGVNLGVLWDYAHKTEHGVGEKMRKCREAGLICHREGDEVIGIKPDPRF